MSWGPAERRHAGLSGALDWSDPSAPPWDPAAHTVGGTIRLAGVSVDITTCDPWAPETEALPCNEMQQVKHLRRIIKTSYMTQRARDKCKWMLLPSGHMLPDPTQRRGLSGWRRKDLKEGLLWLADLLEKNDD